MRKREVLNLAKNHPDRFLRIIELEEASIEMHPVDPGKVRAQWHDVPAKTWMKKATMESKQTTLFDLGSDPEDMACGCYDG